VRNIEARFFYARMFHSNFRLNPISSLMKVCLLIKIVIPHFKKISYINNYMNYFTNYRNLREKNALRKTPSKNLVIKVNSTI
jgi:hypothetical protein